MPLRGTVNDSTEVPFSEFPGAGVKTTPVSVLCYRTFSTEAGTVFKSLFEEMGQKTESVSKICPAEGAMSYKEQPFGVQDFSLSIPLYVPSYTLFFINQFQIME